MRNTKLVRVDSEWEKKMRDIMKERINKNLANVKPSEIGLPEVTRLMTKSPHWQGVELDLRTLPKKAEIKNAIGK